MQMCNRNGIDSSEREIRRKNRVGKKLCLTVTQGKAL